MNKNKVIISIVFGVISIFIVAMMRIQLKTIDQTDITTLESMQEEELRNEILELKEKNTEIENKITENEKKISEYEETLNNSQKASELLDRELKEYEEQIGLTDVSGEGIILTLTDTDIKSYKTANLVEIINELKYAGATAISINDNRIINTTEIVEISKKYILLNGDQRVSSPYIIKAIGDKQKMLETLNLKNEGYIDLYKNAEYDIKIEENSNITIYKYNKDINLEYIKEGEDE